MEIIKGKIKGPRKIVVYGPEGIGKSTFASQMPAPLFIDTEGGTKQLDVDRLPTPSSWQMLLEEVDYAKKLVDTYKTLVIDTMDWAEKLCIKDICASKNVSGIEDFGYGKGYTYLAEKFGLLLNRLTDVIEAGMHVCITAHAAMRKFEQPDEMGAYDRWELKLEKKTAPLLKEWADMLLFANYKTDIITDSKTKQRVATGGKRVMWTSHHPAWDAKNRDELPESLPFIFSEIARIFAPQDHPVETAAKAEPALTEWKAASAPEHPADLSIHTPPPEETANDGLDGLYQPFVDLMRENGFIAEDIKKACGPAVDGGAGYFPADMEIAQYPPGFMEYIVSEWQNFSDAMTKNRLPFSL